DLLYLCRAHIFALLSSCFNLLVRNAVIIKPPPPLLNHIGLDLHISANFTAPGSSLTHPAPPESRAPTTSSGRRSIYARSPSNIGDLPLDIAS
ncbi:MAG TPA: hypothetical protein PLQ49_05070, partial [Methanothrix sp.]|nr:hypothetical protein [Methanothrix sp.]